MNCRSNSAAVSPDHGDVQWHGLRGPPWGGPGPRQHPQASGAIPLPSAQVNEAVLALFQEVIPMHLATSPILSEGASRMECQLKRGSVDRMRSLDPGTSAQASPPTETPSSGSLVKKRRKRRRKSQLDSLKRDDDMNTSEDEDVFPIDMSSDEEAEPPDPPPGSR